MLSASLNASFIGRLPITSRRRSLETTIIESTFLRNSSKPAKACLFLLGPSNVKGEVTTPTVNAPKSLAIFATTGAPPVPVPPPIPAATKTIFASAKASLISFSDS